MNDKLSHCQIEAIEKWDGGKVLSIYPNGSVSWTEMHILQEQSYNSTEFWCAMEYLDDLNVPRAEDETGRTFSIVGRIAWINKINNSVLVDNLTSATTRISFYPYIVLFNKDTNKIRVYDERIENELFNSENKYA